MSSPGNSSKSLTLFFGCCGGASHPSLQSTQQCLLRNSHGGGVNHSLMIHLLENGSMVFLFFDPVFRSSFSCDLLLFSRCFFFSFCALLSLFNPHHSSAAPVSSSHLYFSSYITSSTRNRDCSVHMVMLLKSHDEDEDKERRRTYYCLRER